MRNVGLVPTVPFVGIPEWGASCVWFFWDPSQPGKGRGRKAQATRQMGPVPTHQDAPNTRSPWPGSPGDRWMDHDQEGLSPSLRPVCDPGEVGWQLGKRELTASFLARPH